MKRQAKIIFKFNVKLVNFCCLYSTKIMHLCNTVNITVIGKHCRLILRLNKLKDNQIDMQCIRYHRWQRDSKRLGCVGIPSAFLKLRFTNMSRYIWV